MTSTQVRLHRPFGLWMTTILALLGSVLLFFGCHSGSSEDMGTLRILLTDAPACGFDAVNISVSKVRVHHSNSANDGDSGWAEIVLDPPHKINLLDLTNGALEELGQVPLPAGHYTQLRMVLADNSGMELANSVIPAGGSAEIALTTPSAKQSGIKLIHPFDVSEGDRVDLTLDFDACKSIVATGSGKFLLKPVISVIPFNLNGVGGFVAPSLLGSNVAITAQRAGTVVRSTSPSPQSGEFFLARLEPGSYAVVITADGHATVVITDVPVASSTSSVMLSTTAAPLTLPSSTTHTISGTVMLDPPDDTATAGVTAKQSLPANLDIIVREQLVDQGTGSSHSYSLLLPSEAPLYGSYGPLPITLTAQDASAGLYTLEATASGYQTQALEVDITSTDLVQDFTLVP